MTGFFTLFILITIFNSFNARTSRINILADIKKNPIFLGIIIFIMVIQLIIIYFGGNVFRTYGLDISEIIFLILLSLTVIPVDWIRKYILKIKGIEKGV